MRQNILNFPKHYSIFKGRICPVVRVSRISSSQLEKLVTLGFVVLLETQSGRFSRLV